MGIEVVMWQVMSTEERRSFYDVLRACLVCKFELRFISLNSKFCWLFRKDKKLFGKRQKLLEKKIKKSLSWVDGQTGQDYGQST